MIFSVLAQCICSILKRIKVLLKKCETFKVCISGDRDKGNDGTIDESSVVELQEFVRRTDVEFIPALRDPTSDEFQALAKETCAPVGGN